MKLKYTIAFFFILTIPIIIASGQKDRWPKNPKKYMDGIPPGTVQISNNLYVDESEVTNLDYREYMYWIGSIYGLESPEYKETLPDETQWFNIPGNYYDLAEYYLEHPAYARYPLVGISKDQALSYSKWRTDRILESMLLKYKVIEWRPTIYQHKDSVFTIEKYFTGQYYGITPDPRFMFYPEYYLPDSTTYYLIAEVEDSLNSIARKFCKSKRCYSLQPGDNNCLESHNDQSDKRPYGSDPLRGSHCIFCSKYKSMILHLKGNVREMTYHTGIFYGNSFKDSCNLDYNKCRFDTNEVNVYTGFRNIARWVKWKN